MKKSRAITLITIFITLMTIAGNKAYKYVMTQRLEAAIDSVYDQQFELAVKHLMDVKPIDLMISEPVINSKFIKDMTVNRGLIRLFLSNDYFPDGSYIELSPIFKSKNLTWACRVSSNIINYAPYYCEKDL